MSRRRLAVTVRLLLTLALVPASVHAQGATPINPDAKAHLDKGSRHYEVQEYADAIAEFKEAYKIDPRPEFLYALAQALRSSGDCRAAIRSYESFLRSLPPEKSAAVARENIERCKAEIAAEPQAPTAAPTSEPVAQPTATPAMTTPTTPVEEGPPAPFYKDWTGNALVIGGAVGVVGGGVLWMLGRGKVSDANDAATYDDYVAASDGAKTGETMQTVGVIAAGVGAGLVVGGILHYALVPRTSREPAVAVAPATSGEGALVVLGGRF